MTASSSAHNQQNAAAVPNVMADKNSNQVVNDNLANIILIGRDEKKDEKKQFASPAKKLRYDSTILNYVINNLGPLYNNIWYHGSGMIGSGRTNNRIAGAAEAYQRIRNNDVNHLKELVDREVANRTDDIDERIYKLKPFNINNWDDWIETLRKRDFVLEIDGNAIKTRDSLRINDLKTVIKKAGSLESQDSETRQLAEILRDTQELDNLLAFKGGLDAYFKIRAEQLAAEETTRQNSVDVSSLEAEIILGNRPLSDVAFDPQNPGKNSRSKVYVTEPHLQDLGNVTKDVRISIESTMSDSFIFEQLFKAKVTGKNNTLIGNADLEVAIRYLERGVCRMATARGKYTSDFCKFTPKTPKEEAHYTFILPPGTQVAKTQYATARFLDVLKRASQVRAALNNGRHLKNGETIALSSIDEDAATDVTEANIGPESPFSKQNIAIISAKVVAAPVALFSQIIYSNNILKNFWAQGLKKADAKGTNNTTNKDEGKMGIGSKIAGFIPAGIASFAGAPVTAVISTLFAGGAAAASPKGIIPRVSIALVEGALSLVGFGALKEAYKHDAAAHPQNVITWTVNRTVGVIGMKPLIDVDDAAPSNKREDPPAPNKKADPAKPKQKNPFSGASLDNGTKWQSLAKSEIKVYDIVGEHSKKAVASLNAAQQKEIEIV